MSSKFVVAHAPRVPQVGQLAGVAFVGQEAAATGGLRVVAEAEGFG